MCGAGKTLFNSLIIYNVEMRRDFQAAVHGSSCWSMTRRLMTSIFYDLCYERMDKAGNNGCSKTQLSAVAQLCTSGHSGKLSFISELTCVEEVLHTVPQ